MEPTYHEKIGTVVRKDSVGYYLVQIPGLVHPYRFSERELSVPPTDPDWSDTLDGLDVDELRSLASAALARAFSLLA